VPSSAIAYISIEPDLGSIEILMGSAISSSASRPSELIQVTKAIILLVAEIPALVMLNTSSLFSVEPKSIVA
jgi:hypothetical protein